MSSICDAPYLRLLKNYQRVTYPGKEVRERHTSGLKIVPTASMRYMGPNQRLAKNLQHLGDVLAPLLTLPTYISTPSCPCRSIFLFERYTRGHEVNRKNLKRPNLDEALLVPLVIKEIAATCLLLSNDSLLRSVYLCSQESRY